MTNDNLHDNTLEQLAESYMDRLRRGECPSMTEYVEQHPELADQIRDIFPTLALLEELGPAKDQADSHSGFEAAAAPAMPQRLGEYRIIREIGRGGMGIVYEAEQESLGRHVALKVLPVQASHDAVYLERFRRGAAVAARLHHTNIVPVYGIGEDNGVYYCAMQYIPGRSLDNVLRELQQVDLAGNTIRSPKTPPSTVAGSPLDSDCEAPQLSRLPVTAGGAGAGQTAAAQFGLSTVSESPAHYFRSVARIGVQVAEALAYSHQQGVWHRDIKPANLLLDHSGTVWVTDFGLVKQEGENLTHTGDVVGTLRYMGPERIRGNTGARSDIYSLGLTLYELLTLRPAFDDSDRVRLIKHITDTDPVRPRRLVPHLPRDLETIVLKAIDKDPDRRYTTADKLAEDLRCYLEDRPIQARRVTNWERLWRWGRRNPIVASLTSVVGMLLVIVAIGASVSTLKLSEQAATLKSQTVALALQATELEQQQTTAIRHLHRALDAEAVTERKLLESYLSEARARRWSERAGRRYEALKVLRQAAQLLPALGLPEEEFQTQRFQLRNEVVACLACADLAAERQWELTAPWTRWPAVDFEWKRYAVGDTQGNISVCRIADGQELQRLPGFRSQSIGFCFSPDGTFLAAKYRHPDETDTFQIWDLAQAQVLLKLPMSHDGFAADFSPDSRQVAIGHPDQTIGIYQLADGTERKRWSAGAPAYAVQFRPDGSRLAVSTMTSTIRVWDVATAQPSNVLVHPESVREVAWNGSGNRLATACADSQVYLWNLESDAKPLAVLSGHKAPVTELAFSRQGHHLASGSWDRTIRLWDAVECRELAHFDLPGRNLSFGPDDARLTFTCGTMAHRVTLETCTVATAEERRVVNIPSKAGTVWSLGFSTDGRLLAGAADRGVLFWDMSTREEVAFLPIGHAMSALFHPAGHELITSGRSGVYRWPLRTVSDRETHRLRIGPPQMVVDGVEGRAARTPDGRWLICDAGDSAIVVDLEQPKHPVRLEPHVNLDSVALTPDGQWAATGVWGGSGVKIWNARTGRVERELLPALDRVSVDFSPDAKWLVTAIGPEYGFWKVGTWQHTHQVRRELADNLFGFCAFTPDGRMMAVERTLKNVTLLDPQAGRPYAQLEPPDPETCRLGCFSPDGSQLALVVEQGVHLWNLRLIRQQLADLGLDWDLPPYPPTPLESFPTIEFEIDFGVPTSELEQLAVAAGPDFESALRQYLLGLTAPNANAAVRPSNQGSHQRLRDSRDKALGSSAQPTAETIFQQELKIWKEMAIQRPQLPQCLVEQLDLCQRLGHLMQDTQRSASAREHFREARRLFHELPVPTRRDAAGEILRSQRTPVFSLTDDTPTADQQPDQVFYHDVARQAFQHRPQLVGPGWKLHCVMILPGACAAHFNHLDGKLYVGRSGRGSADGLYCLSAEGTATKLAHGDHVWAVAADPNGNGIFFSEPQAGHVYRVRNQPSDRELWVSGFHPGDDDPLGIALVPLGYSGKLLNSGEALVVDPGFNGPHHIYRFSTTTRQPSVAVLDDAARSRLVDPVDVAIGNNAVYFVDTGAEAQGAIYRLGDDASVTQIPTSEPIDHPIGIAIDPVAGSLFVLDAGAARLVQVLPASGEVRQLVTQLSLKPDQHWDQHSYCGVDFSPDGQQLFITDRDPGVVLTFSRTDSPAEPKQKF